MVFELSRPWGLSALAAPLLLLLLSLRSEAPRSIVTGTLRFWRDLEETSAAHARRRRLPLERLLLILGLTAAALALGGPQRRPSVPLPQWQVLVDTRPAMFLEHTDAAGRPTGEGSRLDVALALLQELRGRLDPTPDLVFRRNADGAEETAAGSAVPRSWLRSPRIPQAAPSWERWDQAHWIWLTDSLPGGEEGLPGRAGYACSGGGPVPGPVATAGGAYLVWDGGGLVEQAGAPARGIQILGDLPKNLMTLIGLWAADRGLSMGSDGVELALEIVGTGTGSSAAVQLQRDGWSASSAVFGGLELSASERSWLSVQLEGSRVPVVAWQPGRVRLSLTDSFTGLGDPAELAVSWAQLLDGAILPASGVCNLEQRQSAGPSGARLPEISDSQLPSLPSWPLVSLLSGLAALLVFAAGLLGQGRV